MRDQPERLDLRSQDVVADKISELLELFPEVRTEDGQIDFERLKLALGESVDAGKERYGLTWPGKAKCFQAIQTPSLGTLLPAPDESVNWDTTENLIIEGDNLEVLKLLQKSYLGKVKMIYLDPPYNTGNDFIYPDNYAESLRTYLEYTGQVDAEGRRFSTNPDTDGRFHSKWLSMMYPRLYLARNLLRDDGVIFISIDDHEVDNLRKLCDDIFGEENFLATFVRKRRLATGLRDNPVSPDHEYVVAFARSLHSVALQGTARNAEDFPFEDALGRFRSTDLTVGMDRHMRPNQFYGLKNPRTAVEYLPSDQRVWRFEPKTMSQHVIDDNIIWPDDTDGRMSRPRFKTRFSESDQDAKMNPVSTWIESSRPDSHEASDVIRAGLNQEGTKELRDIFGDQLVEYPKPLSLLRALTDLAVRPSDLVLDFFAGSGTTAHAVLDLNARDGGNRKFILVQLPEPTERDDYPTIAEITKERVRRAIAKLNEEKGRADDQDRGFRVFKLAESNFTVWDARGPRELDAFVEQLELHVDNVRDDRKANDVLFELLLKTGYPLSATIDALTIEGKPVFSVAEGALLVCLDHELTVELMRAVAQMEPKSERFVVLDEGFARNDQLKANAVQIFQMAGITFKTV